MNIDINIDSSKIIARIAAIVLDYTNTQLSKEQFTELTKKISNDIELQNLLKQMITIK